MDFKLLIILFFSLLFISCDNKLQNVDDVQFAIEDFYAGKDSVLNIRLINNSHKNYYITLDTNRTYNYSAFNEKFNKSVILKPLIYNDGKLVSLKGERFVSKTIGTRKNKCIEDELIKSDEFYKNYVTLKNAIFLKSKTSRVVTIPFSLNFKTCFSTNRYDLKKLKKNELKIEFKMTKEILENDVPIRKRDSLKKKGFIPYYQTIVSNTAKIFL
ncbi:hypothetical protein [Flavobacterium ustbae]|uniref:hypothetical protein n=1 Tax=Flavobacterium ustbae TaxID=2488790 RepID=UPI000F7A1164|nr:hypothetical protein [Flavobacterium ustbae]